MYGVTLRYDIDVKFPGWSGGLVTILYNNKNKPVGSLEEFQNNILAPFYAISERQDAKFKNRIVWGTPVGFGGGVDVGIKGDRQSLESALKDMFSSPDGMGIPFYIYKPNKVFPQNDTYEGIELAKAILESNELVKKVKKACWLFQNGFQYVVKTNK